ncbi:MAG: hypothetical protein ACEQSA_02820 [Weeksellaceae bacterium]
MLEQGIYTDRKQALPAQKIADRLVPQIQDTRTSIFSSAGIVKHRMGALGDAENITVDRPITHSDVLQALPPTVDVPSSYVRNMQAVTMAMFGDKEIRAYDNPLEMTRTIVEACVDPNVVSDWHFRVGYGGNELLSPRFMAYIIPLLETSRRFALANLPQPKLEIFNGVNAAIEINHNNDPMKQRQLTEVREMSHHLVSAFIERFAPGTQIDFQNDPQWDDSYRKQVDELVHVFAEKAQHDRGIKNIIYELAVSAAAHREPTDDHLRQVLRYITIHPYIFDDIQAIPQDMGGKRSFNLINIKETEFGAARDFIRRIVGSDHRGPHVSDLMLRTISRQIPPYYLTQKVDYPIGQWGYMYLNGHSPFHFTPSKLEPNDSVARNQVDGAFTDWKAIARFISPTDIGTGLQAYTEFLADFEQQYA